MQVGQRANLRRHQRAADRQHLAHTVAAALPRSPCVKLRLYIVGRLSGQWRIAGAAAFAAGAVAGRAFGPVELGHLRQGHRSGGETRIVGRNPGAILGIQPAHDSAHFGMFAAAVDIVVELAVKIAGVEPGETRDQPAIAFTLEAVARRAGVSRAAIAPAQRDHLAACGECGVAAARLAASGEDRGQQQSGDKLRHAIGTLAVPGCSRIGGAT